MIAKIPDYKGSPEPKQIIEKTGYQYYGAKIMEANEHDLPVSQMTGINQMVLCWSTRTGDRITCSFTSNRWRTTREWKANPRELTTGCFYWFYVVVA